MHIYYDIYIYIYTLGVQRPLKKIVVLEKTVLLVGIYFINNSRKLFFLVFAPQKATESQKECVYIPGLPGVFPETEVFTVVWMVCFWGSKFSKKAVRLEA